MDLIFDDNDEAKRFESLLLGQASEAGSEAGEKWAALQRRNCKLDIIYREKEFLECSIFVDDLHHPFTEILELAKAVAPKHARIQIFSDDDVEPIRYALKDGAEASYQTISDIIDLKKPAGLAVEALGDEDVETFLALLDKGLDPNAAWEGRSLLSHACRECLSDAVIVLLETGADSNVVDEAVYDEDERGRGPLHWAVLGRLENVYPAAISKRAVKLMLDKGARPDVAAQDGDTPLHLAARVANLPAIQLLLDAGADIEAKGQYGTTPLFHAVQGFSRVRNLLKEEGQDELAAVKLLLDAGADPDASTELGSNALWHARNSDEIVKLFESLGVVARAPSKS